MNLYESFKESMPTNEKLCDDVATLILKGLTPEKIKQNFSQIVNQIHDQVYEEYKRQEESIGDIIIVKNLAILKNKPFLTLNAFFMSISQSRKSRAGSAFEYIIRTLFKRLAYQFSEQVKIDGAKPDFVLPSEDFFKKRPMDCIIFTAKRTLRERWRQTVTEANKGYGFFLATIDENVSLNQIHNMAEHKVYMVVPKSLKESIPAYQSEYNVISFEDFFIKHLDPAVKRWG
ncbi:MAG: hypothetical protein KAZ87_11595 [Spirochaetes bacterium]|nr:hypothetical protein [Spirochaetota bacterium]